MATMGQEQRTIEVRMQDGTTRDGIATGNNATWLCTCERKLPLIGKTNATTPTQNTVVNCPECNKFYHVLTGVNSSGNLDQGPVEHVKECEQPPAR